jgi:predicted ATPase
MITGVDITNFKSLAKFDMSFEKFNCLVGMNGAGKSTILQAIDFASQLLRGRLDDWLEMRQWDIQDLNCKLRKESNITIRIYFRLSTGGSVEWYANFNRHELKCTKEAFFLKGRAIFLVNGRKYRIAGEQDFDINFNYQGSILSQLQDKQLPLAIREFVDYLRNIRSLELLSPHLLRQRARTIEQDIGAGGEKLSAYLDTLKGEQRTNLIAQLKLFYPRIVDFKVSNLRSGWKKLIVIEEYNGQRLETEARHINDGLLRIMAILAQTGTEHSLLLLDEIENGINPEIIEKLVDALVNAPRQILVTTHSPMILNYLEDDVARKSVQFVYKNEQGATLIRPFFSIPHISKKLDFMGAGEAFIDTDLNELTKECLTLDDAEQVAIGDKDAP